MVGLTLQLRRLDINEINENVVEKSRVYTTITPAMILTMSRNLTIRAKYTYGEQEFDDASVGPKSDYSRYTITLNYQFPSM